MKELFTDYGIEILFLILLYFVLISLAAVILTIYDKIISKKAGRRRIPEKTLLAVSAAGGSVAMLIAMLMIRHKTRHIKFMLGLPILILFQAVILLYLTQFI